MVIVIAVAIIMIAMLFAFSSPNGYGMMGGMGYGGTALLAGVVLIVAIVIIVLIILFARPSDSSYSQHQYPPVQAKSPIQVLEQRYAQGELTREQYQLMRSDLENKDQRGKI